MLPVPDVPVFRGFKILSRETSDPEKNPAFPWCLNPFNILLELNAVKLMQTELAYNGKFAAERNTVQVCQDENHFLAKILSGSTRFCFIG